MADTSTKQINSRLHAAKQNKNDEFYTQLADIEKELRHYKDQLRGKVVFCNCDDPYESNFFRFFALNFNSLGLKKLITTSYKPSPIANTQLGFFGNSKVVSVPNGREKVTANKFVINEVHDMDGDGAFNLQDIAEQLKANKNNEWTPLDGDGDFRSPESIELLKEADIVVTNPPFSLSREYLEQLVKYDKEFLIIANKNSVTNRDTFSLIQENKVRTGFRNMNSDMWFQVPEGAKYEKIVDGIQVKHIMAIWLTNLQVAKHNEVMPLYKKYTPEEYPTYDNYDAIEIGKVAEIPADYFGIMGVPITFLDKYNPDQFEIIWQASGNTRASAPKDILERLHYRQHPEDRGGCAVLNNKRKYSRILIRRREEA